MQASKQHKVVHIAMTPLAGSPIRIVQALNTYTDVSARLLTVNPYPPTVGRSYPTDLSWSNHDDRQTFISALENSDIIHLHHWMNFSHNPLGINFHDYLANGKKVIRQFHSNPSFVARHAGLTPEAILNDPLPQLTLPQLHERYYPRARVVPNIVPIEDPLYTNPVLIPDAPLSVYYRPSNTASAWSDRWETKGAPEVMAILNWASQHIPNLRIDADLNGLPYEEHIRRRSQCHVTIDDVVTGSFHLTSLESLAQSRAVICYLDARQLLALAHFTGCSELPFINCSLEDLAPTLDALSKQSQLVKELGIRGRQWMQRYWHPKAMAEHYVNAYRDLLSQGEQAFTSMRFDIHNPADRWLSSELDDLKWLIRRSRMVKA